MNIIPLEEISWFLKDGDRRVIIDSKTKEIVNDFLKLLSHPSYYFFSLITITVIKYLDHQAIFLFLPEKQKM